MFYLVKNRLPKASSRNRTKNNTFFKVEESEFMPEKECFVGQIDIEYESDEDAYNRYVQKQQQHRIYT